VLAAWIVTGPLGHLYAGVVDFVVAVARWPRSRERKV
jgi:hypothetical protein